MSDPLWFIPLLEACEEKLRLQQIPERYWGYISANSPPGPNSGELLGAIYKRRSDLIKRMTGTFDTMGVTVVDGRDLPTIRKWIGGEWWTQKEERKWLKSIED